MTDYDKIIYAIKKIGSFLFARGLPATINFFALSFYAHTLVPIEYGEYSLSLLCASFLSTLIFSWLNMALLRLYEEYKQEHESFLYTIRQTFLFLSFGLILISIPFYFLIHRLLFFIVILTIGQSLFQLCLQLLVSEAKPAQYAILSVFNAAIAVCLSYFFLEYTQLGVLGIIISITIANIIVVSKLYMSQWVFKVKYPFNLKLLSRTFFYGYPLSLSLLIGIILYGLNRFMLDFFWGKQSVGLFSLPYDIANQSVTLIFMALQLYFYPLVLKILHTEGEACAEAQLKKNSKGFLILIIPCLLFFVFFSHQLAQLVSSAPYRQAFTQVLPLITVSAVIQGFKAYYYDLAFQLSHQTKTQLYINTITILFNFLLNLFFISKFNYMGACYASVLTALLAVLLSYVMGKKHFSMPAILFFGNIRIFLCGAVLCLLFFYMRNIANIYLLGFLLLFCVGGYFTLIAFFELKSNYFTLKNKEKE